MNRSGRCWKYVARNWSLNSIQAGRMLDIDIERCGVKNKQPHQMQSVLSMLIGLQPLSKTHPPRARWNCLRV